MWGCYELFGTERGREIHQLVEAATGKPCPCVVGDPSPLAPAAKVKPSLKPAKDPTRLVKKPHRIQDTRFA